MCAPNIFRSSFSNWQTGYATGEAVAKRGHKKIATVTWKYAAGDEMVAGFKEAFEKAGGQVVKELNLPFPNVEFQALLTDVAATKPDGVFAFFAGGGAVKFVKDYAAAGLKKTIPLYGNGFLTDGTLEAQGADAEGIFTALHYADGLNTPRDNAFRLAYAKAYKLQPDVYAVQGYDAAQMLGRGPERDQGRREEDRRIRQGGAGRQDRQPARRVHDLQVEQPGAGFLSSPGGGQGEQERGHRQQGIG